MTNLDKLKHFMAPYYQDIEDESLLNDYLADYVYPECAASALWYELAGKVGLNLNGTLKIDTGAEKFQYSEPGTMQLACDRQGKYYEGRCKILKGYGAVAVKVEKSSVAGIDYE